MEKYQEQLNGMMRLFMRKLAGNISADHLSTIIQLACEDIAAIYSEQ